MYFGKTLKDAFPKADNDNPDNRLIFNFDEFAQIDALMKKSKKLGKVGSWRYFTATDASILFVSNEAKGNACLMTLLKIRDSERQPYRYLLCCPVTSVHYETRDFAKAIKLVEDNIGDCPVALTPRVALVHG